MTDGGGRTPPGSSGPTVSDCDEATLVALFRGDVPVPSGVLVGNGDDAAVLGPAPSTVVTTDMLVEGTHFRRDLSSPRQIGRRAVAQNVSDVLAMGADCTHLVVAVCLPPDLPLAEVAELAAGVHSEAAAAGAAVVGGDVTTGPLLVLAPTATGALPVGVDPVRVDGGTPGDVLALSGWPGRSAAGLDLLLAGYPDGPLQDEHRVPRPPYGLGVQARLAGATALTDVTDGLLRDLAGLARSSGCAAEVDQAALGNDPDLHAAAVRLGTGRATDSQRTDGQRTDDQRTDGQATTDVEARIRAWRLDGGEDHGLLAAFPAGTPVPAGFRVIGRLVAAGPAPAGTVSVDGVPTTPGGWDSARGAAGAFVD